MQKKNNAIVFWRIIATYMIAILHFNDSYYVFNDLGIRMGWYVMVDFFFIVSGYLLYANLEKLSQTCKNGLDYLILRFKKIYPFYLGSFLICFVLYSVMNEQRPIDVLTEHVFELLCMQGIGLDVGWVFVNNSMWYISVMLIAGFIIYHCLVKWKDTFIHFVAPIIIMLVFSYLYRYLGTYEGVTETDGFFLNQALMRALASMCLGVYAVEINKWLQKEQRNTFFVRFLGTLGFLFVIVGSVKYGISQMDYLFVLVLMVAVAIAFLPSQSKFLNSRLIQTWSGWTFPIYMIHYAFCQYVFDLAIKEKPTELGGKLLYMCAYLICITVAAPIFAGMVKLSKRLIEKAAFR